jgi:DNA-binding SARP family transcriptional activator
VIGELEALVAEHPLREHLHAQRMLALYRAGRRSERMTKMVATTAALQLVERGKLKLEEAEVPQT